MDSEVDPRFGRTNGFVLLIPKLAVPHTWIIQPIRISSRVLEFRPPQMIGEAGTEVLITGQIGPKASKVLGHTGIKSYVCTSGMVREAIQALENNALKELSTMRSSQAPGKMGGRGMGGGKRGRGPSQGGQGMGGGAEVEAPDKGEVAPDKICPTTWT